ncbi:hypothetical protein COCMIDRAFT_28175 [Bipolaris oryzae ATCC 44560]|uniref:DUF7872 domain-containing protein n=1 Tax=Bipolaris oryzae ATCC 44560 TaxID=930090 RepID=W6YV65_COCMI|nr:uncharacterized protein COCMIDRAFT_28175 [Bipolaris oryzae ATCC 44560]EUC43337.1 hypothetical protein COCMIDRAFT_28175 [Bipolaris oryzae ATCC 44560]
MYCKPHFLALLSALRLTKANPIAFPQGGSTSCPSEDLNAATWKDLDFDGFLKAAAANLTTNNVQGFASSLGAPNFFCSSSRMITKQCRYVLVAVQKYNSYMNSLNTAISFAASIMSLEIPAVVSDFWPEPIDDVTPLKDMVSLVTSALSAVPFTGALATVNTVSGVVVNFLTNQMKPPEQPNLFVKWNDIGVSIAAAVKDYQSTVANSLLTTLDAEIDNPTSGINSNLAGGSFLGVVQNFTETDMQKNFADSMKLRSIALLLQAQKAYIYRSTNPAGTCSNGDQHWRLCTSATDRPNAFSLRIGDDSPFDITDLMITKYGISKETFLQGPSDCFDEHSVQLFTPEILPIDATAKCIFNLPVCTFNADTFPGRTVQENCRLQGIDV